MNLLFPDTTPSQMGRKDLEQYFTPEWAAVEIVDEFFPDLSPSDMVLEPACGRGAFLKAIPESVPAIGVEIDPELAAQAQMETGRAVLCGDFRTIDIPDPPTVMIGNPPFAMGTFDGFLDRAREILPANGRCGFILPINACQTPSRVLRWNQHWSLSQRLLPRTLFPRARWPVMFLLFVKDEFRTMTGFSLFRQADEMASVKRAQKLILIHGKPNKTCWRALVEWALKKLGGRAALSDIYDAIEPHRPATNRFWQAKVRQQLQMHFRPVERGVWASN